MDSIIGNSTGAIDYSPNYASVNGREFGYYVPDSYDPLTPTPVLLVFHGFGGNNSDKGSADNSRYGWQATAEENGFVVIFPEANGMFNAWDLDEGGSSADLLYVENIIEWATDNYNISESQIFATGHSWGAYFSYYLATYLPNKIAGFGAHSGGIETPFFLDDAPAVKPVTATSPALNGIILHAVDDEIIPYSNSQDLYDDLVENGHNVYQDGIGVDGIIELDGNGSDNHGYHKEYNQVQWDFFLSISSNPEINDLNGDGFVDGTNNYQMIKKSGDSVYLKDGDGTILSDESFKQFDAVAARELETGEFSILLEGDLNKSGKYKVITAGSDGIISSSETRWRPERWMIRNGYEEFFEYEMSSNSSIQTNDFM